MAGKPFLIPGRDDDLLIETDLYFYVETVSNDPEEFEEAVESFKNSEGWQSLPCFFPILFSMTRNKDIGDRSLRIRVLEILKEHLITIGNLILDYLQRNDENEVMEDNTLAVLKNLLPMHVYLYCRYLLVLEDDYLKW